MIERGFKYVLDRLGSISRASGYHHDMQGRVVPLSIGPDESGAPLRPYIAVSPHDTGAVRTNEELHTVTLAISLALFPAPSESIIWEESEARAGLLLAEDAILALSPQSHSRKWDFGDDLISDVRITEKELAARPNDGLPPFVTLTVEVDMLLGSEERGG